MKTKKQLKKLLDVDESSLSREELAGKHSAENRGLPYYGRLAKLYSIHMRAFKLMVRRAAHDELDCDFQRTAIGFVNFLVYIGDIPNGMKRPTVGRRDHDAGYVKGNFAWQSMSENSSEARHRNINQLHRLHKRNRAVSSSLVKKIRTFRDRKLKSGWSKADVIRHVVAKTTVPPYTVKEIVLNQRYVDV